MFLYDSIELKITVELIDLGTPNNLRIPNIRGLTCIDLKGNDKLYERFRNKGIDLKDLPLFIVSYNGENRSYLYNVENLNKIKEKVSELLAIAIVTETSLI
jgi:hypothetical protein